MEIKRINDRQIRCVMTADDLREHQLSVKELRYGSSATSALFREVVDEAASQYGFNEDDLPLMIEAVPLQNDELLLIISAVEDAEELDPHFAKYAEPINDAASEVKEQRFTEPENSEETLKTCVFSFDDIDSVMELCSRLTLFPGTADLYRKPDENGFYLVVFRPEEMDIKAFNVFINTVAEHADVAPRSEVLSAYLSEHCEPAMKDAIRALAGH